MHDEFKGLWTKARYPKWMASARVCKPPNAKFWRVYYFTTGEYAKSDIEHGQIKVSRFSDLNDPFELAGMNLTVRGDRISIKEMRDEYNEQRGLICFTRNWRSPLLWSHYAEKHKGVCLGFNVRRTWLYKVEYARDRVLRSDEINAPDRLNSTIIKHLCKTKSAH